ncbi:MAG: pilus assembly protein PilM [Clostridia bacterium]|nr:pilus assembly protein PilM [Clostridia bacterium]
MAVKVLNIEAGKRLTKVCVSEKKGKAYSVSESFSFPTPDGCVLDGQIVSEVTLGDKLMGELSNRDIKASEVFFSIASTKVATREVEIPVVKDEQVKGIIQTNAADYLPIDVEKYSIDAVILGRDEEQLRVLVIAVPNAIVNSYIALADYTGLVIRALDFSGNSQFQVFKGIGGDGVNMFVSVDTDASSVTFIEDGQLLLQRFIPVGGDEMICRYMGIKSMEDSEYLTALGEISETADEIEPTVHLEKPRPEDEEESHEAVVEEDASDYGVESDHGYSDDEEDDSGAVIEDEDDDNGYGYGSDDNDSGYDSNDSYDDDNDGYRPRYDESDDLARKSYPELDDSLQKILGGILRSVDFFQGSKYTDKMIEKIIIVGSCAHLRGLKTRLFESIGADTFWLEEVKDVQHLANSIDDISVYVNCLGARLAPLDILPADYIARTGKKKNASIVNGDNFGIVAVIACGIIALAITGYSIGTNLYRNSQLKKVNAQIDQLAYAEQEYNEYVLYKSGDTNLQDFINGYVTPNAEVVALLEEMELKMPSNITVLSANFTETGVSFNVTVPSFDEAANVLRQFRSFESIDVIECTGLTRSSGEGSSEVTFNIICNYPVVETTTAAPETTAAEETEAE